MDTQSIARHHLDVPGGRLYYEVRGSGPLLLVIGQPMTSAPFAPLADLLAEDHTVVTYDPPGLGESTVDDRSRDVTPEIEADGLARIIDAVGGGPADMFGSSGGAVAGLALAARHPEQVRTLIAHEPPVAELLPDAAHVRAAVGATADAFRAYGSGAGWANFVSLVMHDGPLTEAGPAPAQWPPSGAGGGDSAGPNEKQQADDELFFLRMLKPFTRYQPPIDVLRAGRPRIVVGVGEASRGEIAPRAARALAERLGSTALGFPGDHGGFMADPAGFSATIRRLTAFGSSLRGRLRGRPHEPPWETPGNSLARHCDRVGRDRAPGARPPKCLDYRPGVPLVKALALPGT
ncbi:MAG TPA: alpha/beta hydrolase [Blastococcus sp.]|jgi:pimeloyl-ACP methyl ester carboxylesterase|nr:alpha/beta hydrolase [Blastococcus sp.]